VSNCFISWFNGKSINWHGKFSDINACGSLENEIPTQQVPQQMFFRISVWDLLLPLAWAPDRRHQRVIATLPKHKGSVE